MALNLETFQYDLPQELIAQTPAGRRDRSRLMLLDRTSGKVSHHLFCGLPELLRRGDLLVVNDTRVLPARFFCRRKTGGQIEGLFVGEKTPGRWEVMLRNAGKCRPGEIFSIAGSDEFQLRLAKNLGQGGWLVEVLPEGAKATAAELLGRFGHTPLPPYIRRPSGQVEIDEQDSRRYQTIYAARDGAVAAPTAGLHFTDDLLARLGQVGIERASLTLHVGPGTFAPVKTADISEHKMHAEWFDLPAETAGQINSAKATGRRVVAVGTTSVRVLETAAGRSLANDNTQGMSAWKYKQSCMGGTPMQHTGKMPVPPTHRPVARATTNSSYQKIPLTPCSGWTDIFMYPPAEFHAVDALITNFHLPGSTLLMLVAAFCAPGSTGGIAIILDAYRQAIAEKYRFYSYGDAMLIV
ncbi:MAG: S-adenosylmethionine:tRNA ribosyltransferase-isomerase [Planctomycetes bacterium]|nr:S-adenosylmethionine:tRNA ribosyltransferase-isomerase [Planctomycetota bacterium]